MIKVLFVCLGNICRSPSAEGIFRYQVNKLENKNGSFQNLYIDSAGTAGFHVSSPPDKRAQLTALRYGVNICNLKARKLSSIDFESFDYLVAMDNSNFEVMKKKCPPNNQNKLHLFMSFSENNLGGTDVPDPYYGDIEDFEKSYKIIERASDDFLKFLINKHNL